MPAPAASVLALLVVVSLALSGAAQDYAADPDRDGDGLSDFQEIHKYLTNPDQVDSDGDGRPDGDWLERREYQYVVRSVIQVMRPVTLEYLSDDYQDVRVLDETDDYVELEVIHYPFNTVAEAIKTDPDWRDTTVEMSAWLRSGPTSDWDASLREALIGELQRKGIDPMTAGDKELCEQAADWLVKRSRNHDAFIAFQVGFDDQGKPFVPEALKQSVAAEIAKSGLDLGGLIRRQMSARGMFAEKTRGSCSSSAIYLCGCLRALGIPTRIILSVPVIDASDERERRMLTTGISHHGLRKTIRIGLAGSEQSWTSHTANEVFIGGRWRRLNYGTLGQNIADPHYAGLLTHIATFREWADARIHETVGLRQKGGGSQDDVFGHRNPYSCISLRDSFGEHCRLANEEIEAEEFSFERLHWSDSQEIPADIRAGLSSSGRGGLIAEISGFGAERRVGEFLRIADRQLTLEASGFPGVEVALDLGCWWQKDELAYVHVPIDPSVLTRGVAYSIIPRNDSKDARLTLGRHLEPLRR